MSDDLPDIFIGSSQTPLDSVVPVTPDEDPDPDDDLLAETPQDVIDALGFDPLEFEDDDAELDQPLSADMQAALGLDDANWKEGDHPRDEGGKFTTSGGGAAAAATLPAPSVHAAGAGKSMQQFAQTALKGGFSPHDIANTIKELASKYKHHAPSVYGNAVLQHLEKTHGLKPGTLGKAKPKGAPGAPAPAKAAPAGLNPHVEATNAAQKAMVAHLAGIEAAKKAMAEAAPPPSPTTTAAKAKGPEPHADSTPQKAIHEIATGAGTDAEKIAKIKEHPTVIGYPHGYTAQFAKQWVEALGGKMDAPAAPAAPAPAAPTPAPPAPKAASSSSGGTTKSGNAKRFARGAALRAGAADEPHAGTAAAKKICPSLSRPWWDTVDPKARAACDSYKGGSHSINSLLRNWKNTAKHTHPGTQGQVDAIDELFEHPDAKLTDDVMLRRGEDVPADEIAKWKDALANGNMVRPQREGFTSTSMASQAAFSSKNTIYEIVARKGTPALGIWAASSSFKSENEVLLRHGTVFEVYEIEQVGKQHIVRCHTF